MINPYKYQVKYLCHLRWSKSFVYISELIMLFLLISKGYWPLFIFFFAVFGAEEYFTSKKLQEIEKEI